MSGALLMMLGETSAKLALNNANVFDLHESGGTASASYRVADDGSVESLTNSAGTVTLNASTDWWRLQPSGILVPQAPGTFQVRATLQSGTTPSGSALDTRLDISGNPTWTLSQSGNGMKTCELLVELRGGGGVGGTGSPGPARWSATIDITAQVTTA